MSLKRKLLYGLGGIVGLLVIGVAGVWIVTSAPRPTGGVSGAEADALAHRIEREVKLEEWAKTGAITWTHAKRNTHLWDRQRNFDRVRFQDGSEVLLDVNRREGIATAPGGQKLTGEENQKAVEKAYKWWINDTFWLNPFGKFFDEGVTREKIAAVDGEPGSEGLYVKWSSGGVTPGDSYLWIVPAGGGPPKAWRMWVSVLPIGGLHVTWEGWKNLESGGMIATRHELAGAVPIEIGDLKSAATLGELTGGSDPFAALGGPAMAKTATVAQGAASSQPSR